MDIATHILTGVLLSAAFDEPTAKAACILGSEISDIALLPIYYHIYKKQKLCDFARSLAHVDKLLPKQALQPYWLMHSLLPVCIVFVVGVVINNTVVIAFCIACCLHILWDIPTHTRSFACRPFYPVSERKWEGLGDWWRTKYGVTAVGLVWCILGGILFCVL